MPQFDFATYPAQIFWFLLCFAALYFYISKIIIPRVKDIIANRKSVIDKDLLGCEELNKEIDSIKEKSENITREADLEYKDLIAKAAQDSKIEKEKHLNEFKDTSEKLIDKSRDEIKKLIEDSESKVKSAAVDLSSLVKDKLFSLK